MKRTIKESIWDWVKAILLAVIIAAIAIQFIKPALVSGASMEPNFEDNLIISRQAYEFGDFQRGDVVVFQSELPDEKGKDKLLIKRIIALPGESVSVENGRVYINGQELKESCTKDGITSGTIDKFVVPEGKVFCLGDNRLDSTDSRDSRVGCVDEEQIIGKVVFRVFPFNEFGKIGRLL